MTDILASIEADERAMARIATAIEACAVEMKERNRIERERLDKEFPAAKPKRLAEIVEREADKREQFSDKPTQQWLEETEAATPSKFKKRFDEANQNQSKGGGSVSVPNKDEGDSAATPSSPPAVVPPSEHRKTKKTD